MTKLTVTIKERTNKQGETGWEGTVNIPGLKTTKVARASDGETFFSRKASLNSTARALGKRLGFDVELEEVASRKAAKKSVKTKTKRSKR